jgi:hypothetical protein
MEVTSIESNLKVLSLDDECNDECNDDNMQIDTVQPFLDSFNLPFQLVEVKDDIEKTDDNGTLQIYSYKSCTNSSSDKLKSCRGLIFNKEILVAGSLGYTLEYNEETILNVPGFSDESICTYSIFPSEEGTLLRVYFFNDKWFISTHRKIDAFKSHWGSGDSFGEIFLNCIGRSMDEFTSTLDKFNVYFFLIRNTKDNRLVSYPPSVPTVYHIGTLLHNETFTTTLSIDVPKQQEMAFTSIKEICEFVKTCDPLKTQGIILFSNNGSGKNIKIVTSRYQNYNRIRNNEPNLTFRFIQLWKDRQLPIFTTFLELYPEFQEKISVIESFSINIATYLQNMYFKKFVKKEKLVFQKDEWNILKNVHAWYWTERQTRKVTFDVMYKMMLEDSNIRSFYQLFKRLK